MKKRVTNAEELSRAIAELELAAAAQKKDIQETFAEVSESLKPVNLAKSGLSYVFSGNHKEELFNILLGVGTGILSRKLLFGRAHGFVGRNLGKAIQWGIAGLISKNAERIKEKAGEVIDRIFKRRRPGSKHSPAPVKEYPPSY